MSVIHLVASTLKITTGRTIVRFRWLMDYDDLSDRLPLRLYRCFSRLLGITRVARMDIEISDYIILRFCSCDLKINYHQIILTLILTITTIQMVFLFHGLFVCGRAIIIIAFKTEFMNMLMVISVLMERLRHSHWKIIIQVIWNGRKYL